MPIDPTNLWEFLTVLLGPALLTPIAALVSEGDDNQEDGGDNFRTSPPPNKYASTVPAVPTIPPEFLLPPTPITPPNMLSLPMRLFDLINDLANYPYVRRNPRLKNLNIFDLYRTS